MPKKVRLERSVKADVKKLLDPYKPHLYYNMPVPSGYGKSMLDFVGCFCGLFFMVETKRARKDLTGPQLTCAEEVEKAGGKVFVIRDKEGLDELALWLKQVDAARL